MRRKNNNQRDSCCQLHVIKYYYLCIVVCVQVLPAIVAFGTLKLPHKIGHNLEWKNSPATESPILLRMTYENHVVATKSSLKGQTATSTQGKGRRRRKANNNSSSKQTRRRHWDEMIPRLRAFRDKHGHCNIARDDGDLELFEWVRTLRYNYLHQIRNTTDPTGKRKRLSKAKLQVLNDLGFCWETNRRWDRFDIMLQQLKDYKNRYGHTRVSPSNGVPELYEWTKYIRYNFRHQALNHSTPSTSYRPLLARTKLKALDKIGFDWEMVRKKRRWEDMFPRLQAFHEKHGHTRVNRMDADTELYFWTQSLISNYGPQIMNQTVGEGRPVLSSQKLKLLHEMDFSWESQSSMWERRYEELRKFYKENGHCRVPTRLNPQLGVFVQNQRQEYRRYLAGNATTLTPERIKALGRIKFEWARSHDKAWEERRDELEEFWSRAGHSDVPQNFTDNPKLGQWCMNQRTSFSRRQAGFQSGMTEERIRKLNNIRFQWNYKQSRWEHMLGRLQRYQELHGGVEINTGDVENSDLRQWLNEQRHFYRTNHTKMTTERITALESLPEFSWRRRRGAGPSKDDWSQLFVAIREKGISPEGKTKKHWFEGVNRFQDNVKTEWTEQELLALWNEENEDDDEAEGEDYEYFDENDEDSRLFLRA